MQNTLLAVAIALILALLTALIGPSFINWNDHRAFFEAEASRLVGLKVRVQGDIDVGILPFPSVTLGKIELGPAGEPSRLRAKSLSIEFGLGPLMRGEIRAVVMKLAAPEFSVGLNSLGRIDWPAMALSGETLSIDKLNVEDGRAVLTDAVSNSRLVLDKLWFKGSVKSLTGPFTGDGAFVTSGALYGYHVRAGRLDDTGMRVRLGLDTAERPLTVETDGQIVFEGGSPRFEGNFSMSRIAGTVSSTGRAVIEVPWKLTSKVTAGTQSALFEQVEYQYGADEQAAKLTGAAEFKFGERPRLQGALSAHQIDLDRLIATTAAPRRHPLAATQAFAELFGGALRPAVPVNLTISVDSVTLGGAALQSVGCDLRLEGNAWRLDKLEFRAPGFTQISLSGRLDPSAKGVGFKGLASIDANDPKTLVAWLAGKPAPVGQIKPWQARGEVALSSDRIAIEQLKTEFDRGTIEGRLAYIWSAPDHPARLDAELRAGDLDIDALTNFAEGALSGMDIERPREVALALDIARAKFAGFEARNTQARLKFDASGIAIEKLSVADFGKATIDASGRIDTTSTSPGGNITVDLDARELDGVLAALQKFSPVLANPLRKLAGVQKTAKLRASVSLENSGAETADAKLALTGRVGLVGINVTAGATGKPEAFAVTDLRALSAADVRLDARLQADDGGVLLSLFGLRRLAGTEKKPGELTFAANGPLSRELRIDAKLVAGSIDATGKGRIKLPADDVATIELEPFAGTIAGSKVSGKLAVRFGDLPKVEGTIETQSLDAPAVIAAAIGMPRDVSTWSLEPFSATASDLSGRIEFRAQRATISPTLEAQSLRGVVRFDPSQVVFDEIAGEFAKGRLDGRMAFVMGADGLSMQSHVKLGGADAAILVGSSRPSITGRVGFEADAAGSGLSPAAFIGSIAGNGAITLENAGLAGLNPRVFDAVIRAVDLGIPTTGARIRDFVTSSLDIGSLPASRIDGVLTINGSHIRLGNVAASTTAADLAVSASVDLGDGKLDALLTLTGSPTAAGDARPAISISLKGPIATPSRTVDASALTTWLALRAVEQQSKRLDAAEKARREAIEKEEREAAEREKREAAERERRAAASSPAPAVPDSTNSVPPPAPDQRTDGVSSNEAAPPLPPAITILPVPLPKPRPDASASAQHPALPPQSRPNAPRNGPVPPSAPLDLLGAQR